MHLTAELSLYVIIVPPCIANYRFKFLILFQFYLLKYFIHDKITYRVGKVNRSLPFYGQLVFPFTGSWSFLLQADGNAFYQQREAGKDARNFMIPGGFDVSSFTLCFVDR